MSANIKPLDGVAHSWSAGFRRHNATSTPVMVIRVTTTLFEPTIALFTKVKADFLVKYTHKVHSKRIAPSF
jgi:hypothetical protein